MTLPRHSTPLFATAAALLAAIIGCSHPLEVDLPAGYAGRVTVLCEKLSEEGKPIEVGADGIVKSAVCPRSRRTLVVVRGGEAIKPVADPHWSTTGDGIVLAIQFDVQ